MFYSRITQNDQNRKTVCPSIGETVTIEYYSESKKEESNYKQTNQ